MLRLLHIENIAVIERAEISFDRGFNILTGETGAGKSIVIDAISAILGERAYRDMIRTGAAMASVQAIFSDVPRFAWFEENAAGMRLRICSGRIAAGTLTPPATAAASG